MEPINEQFFNFCVVGVPVVVRQQRELTNIERLGLVSIIMSLAAWFQKSSGAHGPSPSIPTSFSSQTPFAFCLKRINPLNPKTLNPAKLESPKPLPPTRQNLFRQPGLRSLQSPGRQRRRLGLDARKCLGLGLGGNTSRRQSEP